MKLFPTKTFLALPLFISAISETCTAFAPLHKSLHAGTMSTSSSSLRQPPEAMINPSATTAATAWSSTATTATTTSTTSTASTSSSTALSAAAPDVDLVVGFGTIAAACTPYFLGLVFKDFFNDSFFLPVYANDDEGRIAEIGWKVRYATLGLALTTLAFLEVYLFPENDPARILKDSYIVWAIFYTEATRKIRAEATSDPPILSDPSFGGRLGTQVWHLLVVLVLWADVSESYTGNAITNFIKDVFT
jgi:hypothetical protein